MMYSKSFKYLSHFCLLILPLLVLVFNVNGAMATSTESQTLWSQSSKISKDVCEPKIGKLKCKNYQFSGDWSKTNFSNADLRNVVFAEGSSFYGANFSGADLSGADFRSMRQKNAPTGDDFDSNYVVCSSTSCPKVVDLRNTNFSNARLNNVYFGSALLSWAKFDSAWLSGASFSSQTTSSVLDMSRTSFINAYMEDASFYRVDLTNANFSKARLSRAQFISSNLTRTNFYSSMLERASFNTSLISLTDFRKAVLTKVRFTNGCIPSKTAPTICK
jgi:uncharacterized protein YjbI with pentapeptide repeats